VRQRKADLPGRLEQISRQLQQQGKSPSEIKRLLNRQKRQFEEQIERLELEIKRAERQNEQEFTRLAGQMLVRLYHEAFHAYLDDFVYPHREYDVPAWLNEGLAMVFEVGLPEGGSLRLDAPNASALATLKADLAGPQPLALEQVLAADSRQFLVVSAAASQESQRYYAYAWGLVYYLTFQQRLLGSAALDRYVSPSAKTLSPRERFERLVGQPLEDFDKRWRDSMRRLR